MIEKPIDQIGKDDISSLVADAVRESRRLEYKQELPGGDDEAKMEFLADISSFANASGGDIVYGVTAKRDGSGKPTGEPDRATGAEVANLDAEKLRLESIIRNGIEPRLPRVHIHPIDGFQNGPVIILRVGQSWTLPHMVTYKGRSRFYSRNSAGKYQLDVSEIRSAFLLSEGRADSVRQFRDARLAKIVANEAPIPLQNGLTCVLHLHPVSPVQCDVVRDIDWVWDCMRPLSGGLQDYRFNIDGLLAHGNLTSEYARRQYVQVFRNGTVESVVSEQLEIGANKTIASYDYESAVISGVSRYLRAQHDLGIDPPIVFMLSLLGAKGYTIRPRDPTMFDREDMARQVDRDLLLLPDVMLQPDDATPIDAALKVVFDALWQSAGWSGSRNYNSDGRHMSVAPA